MSDTKRRKGEKERKTEKEEEEGGRKGRETEIQPSTEIEIFKLRYWSHCELERKGEEEE